MLENHENMCRLCLSKEGLMFPIFRNCSLNNETSFRSKIMSCTSIEVFADDNLPMKVCFMCVHQVEKFYRFRAMCENSDAVLRSTDNKPFKSNEKNDFCSDKTNFTPDYYSNESYTEEKTFDTTCFVCSCIFLTNEMLIDHLTKSHSDLEIFICKGCQISFPDVQQFKNHLNAYHKLTCDYCDCVFKFHKNLQEHLKSHSNFLNCKFCNKPFSDPAAMRNHELEHSNRYCGYCSIEFDSNEEYLNHAKNCVQMYFCKFCEKKLPSKKDLIKHVNTCHDNFIQKCNNCNKNLKFDEIQEHKCEILSESLQCKTCLVNFSDEASLVTHISEEHKTDLLTCKFCTKKFSLKSSLKRHEKSHSGVKPYQCKFCPRKFKDSSACVVHTRTHTGEHPFQCEECHKDFKQLANLKMHTYRHHKKNQKLIEEKPDVLNQANDYEHLYSGEIVESYSDNMQQYQQLNDSISTTFNHSMNLLIPDHR